MSGSCNREGEKDPRVSRDGEPVPRLQHVTVNSRSTHWSRNRLAYTNRSTTTRKRSSTTQTQTGASRPRLGVTTNERAVDDKTDVIRLYNMI